jgi:two-component system sensor histidine kinase MprB
MNFSAQKLLVNVKAQLLELTSLVGDLLDLSRAKTPSGGSVQDDVPLHDVVENAVRRARLRGDVLTVRDCGPGIPSEDLPYVFDRFWRSPSARALPGSGLGLAIVARAVREAGGEVRLGPADGGGTLAWLRLPGSEAPPEGGRQRREHAGFSAWLKKRLRPLPV